MMALDQLRGLRRFITPEGVWLPGRSYGAVDADGCSYTLRAVEAVGFGALARLVRLRGDPDERLRAVDLLRHAVGAKHPRDWEQEPGRTQAEVLDAGDRAIAIEEDRR